MLPRYPSPAPLAFDSKFKTKKKKKKKEDVSALFIQDREPTVLGTKPKINSTCSDQIYFSFKVKSFIIN